MKARIVTAFHVEYPVSKSDNINNIKKYQYECHPKRPILRNGVLNSSMGVDTSKDEKESRPFAEKRVQFKDQILMHIYFPNASEESTRPQYNKYGNMFF